MIYPRTTFIEDFETEKEIAVGRDCGGVHLTALVDYCWADESRVHVGHRVYEGVVGAEDAGFVMGRAIEG